MRKWWKLLAAVGFLCMTAVVSKGFFEGKQGLPPKEERLFAVSRIWKEASDFYGLWDLADQEPSWDKAYEMAYREAAAAKTSREYHLALKKFLAHLHDGHADHLRSPEIWKAYLPFQMDFMDQKFVITATFNEEAYPLGAVVETVNDEKTGVYLETVWGPYVGILTPGARETLLCRVMESSGKKGDSVLAELSLENGERKKAAVKWEKRTSQIKSKIMEPMGEVIYRSEAFVVRKLPEDLMHVNFLTMGDMSYINEWNESVVPVLSESSGVILDLRKNSGGNSAVGKAVVESFAGQGIPNNVRGPISIKVQRDMSMYRFWKAYEESQGKNNVLKGALESVYEQQQTEIQREILMGKTMYEGRFHVSPKLEEALQKELFEWGQKGLNQGNEEVVETAEFEQLENSLLKGVPLVLLVHTDSGSATDSTAAMAKNAGFRLVGTRTKGATGNVVIIPAGEGWQVQFSSQRTLTPTGGEINNHGVEADIFVDQTVEDFREGKDTALLAAVEYMKEIVGEAGLL